MKLPKRPIKKDNKPRRLKFKSKGDKKKILCSIEDTERVSIESLSSDDETVVEQSLMQHDPVSSSEVLDEEGDSDLHILMVDPDPPPSFRNRLFMGKTDLSCAIGESESLTPLESNIRIIQSTKKCFLLYRLPRALSLPRQPLLCLKPISWSTVYNTSLCQLLIMWSWPNPWFLHHPWLLLRLLRLTPSC